MTEKKQRFKEIISTQKVIDTQTGKEYDCLLDNDLFDLINTIAEENEQLKKELEDALLDVKIYKNANATFDNVYQENEKLKSKIEYLERKIERERNATNKQYEKWEKEALEKINKLEKENEQLKEALREELQCNGSKYDIELFDDLFDLDYDEWNANEEYRESMNWEKLHQEKINRLINGDDVE